MVALTSNFEKFSIRRSSDNLGTVRDIVSYDDVNDETIIRKHIVYDSFGNVTDEEYWDEDGDSITSTHAEAVDQLFFYTGRAFDEVTGLQNNLNRWFDPTVGRWLSEDPIGFAAGDPNVYRYVGNFSTGATDPSGLVPTDIGPDGPRQFGTVGTQPQPPKSDRAQLLADADAVGLGKDVREILRLIDKRSISINVVIQLLRAADNEILNYFDDDRDKMGFGRVGGPCGSWTILAAEALLGTKHVKNPKLTVETVYLEKYHGATGADLQNAVRLTFTNASGKRVSYYIDNGMLGGDGQVFGEAKRDRFLKGGSAPNELKSFLISNPPLTGWERILEDRGIKPQRTLSKEEYKRLCEELLK